MKDEYEIYLRPLREEDAKTSWRWRNDPRVWAQTVSRPDREVTEAMELDWLRKVMSDPTRRNFAIVLKNGDRYVGNVYLTNIRDGVGEQGTFIGEVDLWGKGIGSRARDALAKIAKADLGLRAIKSRLRVENVASLKSNLKIGFREVSRDKDYVYLERAL